MTFKYFGTKPETTPEELIKIVLDVFRSKGPSPYIEVAYHLLGYVKPTRSSPEIAVLLWNLHTRKVLDYNEVTGLYSLPLEAEQ